MIGWTSKLRVLSPSLAHFPMHINNSLLELFRAQILRENTLPRFSPLFFFNHFRVCDFVHFYFGFSVILKNPSTRGPHLTMELSLTISPRFSHLIFVLYL